MDDQKEVSYDPVLQVPHECYLLIEAVLRFTLSEPRFSVMLHTEARIFSKDYGKNPCFFTYPNVYTFIYMVYEVRKIARSMYHPPAELSHKHDHPIAIWECKYWLSTNHKWHNWTYPLNNREFLSLISTSSVGCIYCWRKLNYRLIHAMSPIFIYAHGCTCTIYILEIKSFMHPTVIYFFDLMSSWLMYVYGTDIQRHAIDPKNTIISRLIYIVIL